jgi:hypothetical protein
LPRENKQLLKLINNANFRILFQYVFVVRLNIRS